MLIRRGRILLSLALGCGVLGLWVPASANAGWNQPWRGVSPTSGGINQSTNDGAAATSLTAIGGVPYVAWSEANQFSRTNYEVRVARFNPATNGWEQPWVGVSPTYGGINQSTHRFGLEPRLSGIDGVPYVAWHEFDESDLEVRVARLNASTSTWEQPWSGASATHGGIEQSPDRSGAVGDLEEIDAVLHVAWLEHDGSNFEVRVARLNTSIGTWAQPWAGVSDGSGAINQSSSQDALSKPSLTAVGGVPYVAWNEFDGTNHEVRVARLNPSSNAWEQPWSGVSATHGAVNQSSDQHTDRVSLSTVGGVPYVAWEEEDGTLAREVRVARLNVSTSTWEQPWSGASATYGGVTHSSDRGGFFPTVSPIGAVPYAAWQEWDGDNWEVRVARLDPSGPSWEEQWSGVGATSGGVNQSSGLPAEQPSLSAINGVPYVSWQEAEGFSTEARVARLEPEYRSVSAQPSTRGANLTATARTFGVPYSIGFAYGDGLASETTTDTAAAGEETTVTRQVSGLSPNTVYRYRPFALAGVPSPKAFGPTGAFTTAGVAPSGGQPAGDTKAPQTRIRRHPPKRTRKRRATFRFFTTEPGATFECKLDRRPFRPCESPVTVRAKPGKHTFQVRARDAAGNVDGSPARFTWKLVKRRR